MERAGFEDLPGYGTLADHFEIGTPLAGLTLLWRALRLRAPRRWERPRWKRSASPREFPFTASICRARPAAGNLADARSALQQGLLSRPGDRGAHPFARQCAPPSAPARTRRPAAEVGTELFLESAPVGVITSTAELALGGSVRRVALGMVRSEAEVKSQPLTFAGGTAGTAKILDKPPAL